MHRWRIGFAAHHGLTLTDTTVLAALLEFAADEDPGGSDPDGAETLVTAAALASAVRIASGRLTGSLDRLAAAGFARRVRNPTDRRSVLVALTGAGRQAGVALDRALAQVVADGSDPAFRARFTARVDLLTEAVRRAHADFDRPR